MIEGGTPELSIRGQRRAQAGGKCKEERGASRPSTAPATEVSGQGRRDRFRPASGRSVSAWPWASTLHSLQPARLVCRAPRAPLREPWPAAVEHAGAALAALQLRESVFPQSSSRPVPGSPLQLTHLNVAAAAASDCLAGEEAEGLLGRHRCPYTRASGAEPTCSLHVCAPAFNPT